MKELDQKKKRPSIHNFFAKITGFGHQRVFQYMAEIAANDGFLLPPVQRGPQVYMLENDYPEFENWVDAQALRAMNGYLTVDNLLPEFTKQFGAVVSYNVLRRALVRLDFNYQKRERGYVSNKWKPEILQMLATHVALVRGKVDFNPATGRWYFRNPTVYSDEAYILSGEMRSMSWCRQKNKYRNVLKGGNKRWCMVGTIFSHNPDGVKGVLKHWNMGWKVEKEGRPYFGKMDSTLCLRYFKDEVMPHFNDDVRATLYLDNWSVHKKFEIDFGKTAESQMAWMWKFMEKEIAPESEMYKEWCARYVAVGGKLHVESIMDFVKQYKIPVRQMEKLGHDYNVQVQFLPPYWSPCNPVEFLWARIKQLVRDMDQKIDIATRIDRAWNSITVEFVDQCIDRSIRFCLSWHARLRGAGNSNWAVGTEPTAAVRKVQFGPVDPDSDAESDSDDGDDDDDDEADVQVFKRYRP